MASEKTRPGPSEGWPIYMADWRERNPGAVIENRLKERARQRAKNTLARMHPDDYAEIYDEELSQVRLEWAANEADEGRAALELDTPHRRKHVRQRAQREKARQWIDDLSGYPLAPPAPISENAKRGSE